MADASGRDDDGAATVVDVDWREGYVPGGETRFWVRETGRGDDLAVLLHGFPFDGGSWAGVAGRLAAAGWRVAAPDVKGVGRTRSTSRDHDPRTLADEVSQLVRNLHARRVVLVGHDWGGAVALATAFRHPGRVAAAVLVGSPYRRIDLRHAWHIALCNVPVLPEVAFRLAPRPLVALAAHAQATSDGVDRASVRDGARALGGDPGAWLRYYRTLSRRAVMERAIRRTRERVPLVADPIGPQTPRVPVHVVWGECDPVFPLAVGAGVARDLAAEIDVLRGIGHHVPLEDPSGLVRSVQRFALGLGMPSGVADVGTSGRGDAAAEDSTDAIG